MNNGFRNQDSRNILEQAVEFLQKLEANRNLTGEEIRLAIGQWLTGFDFDSIRAKHSAKELEVMSIESKIQRLQQRKEALLKP